MAQMDFVQNKGQWDKRVNYRSDFRTGSFFLENKGFTVMLHNPDDVEKLSDFMHGESHSKTGTSAKKVSSSLPASKFLFRSFAYNVSFLGAANNAQKIAEKPLPSYNNYFMGNNPANWATDCKIYGAVTYKNIYPNIDIRYYSAGEELKYDFIVRPGGNPDAIALRYDGGVKLSIKNKELIIGTTVGEVKELAPYSYQASTDKTPSKIIDVSYVLKDNVVSFNVANYDTKATLIIDPQIIFCTLTGSTSDNWGYTATPGPDGSFYAGGIVFGSGFPASPGAFQTTFSGGVSEGGGAFSGVDIGIFKFSPNGSQRIYATYLGGSGNEQPHSMIVDASGNLVVAGRTNSTNYPIRSGFDSSGTGFDIVVTKFNANGTALIGSAKIGGSADDGVNFRPKFEQQGANSLRRNYGDDARSEVILDGNGNIYLSSCTQSNDFPTVLPFQSVVGGKQDGVILKINPTFSNLLFSSYFGGAEDDACFVAAINPANNILYIGGATSSGNLPGNKTNTISGSINGITDGFVTQLPLNGAAIIKTTYIGTNGIDLVYGLKFDRLGFPYIMGTTTGNWQLVNAPFSNPGSKHFIAKMQPDFSSYIYSTVFGKDDDEPCLSPIAFLVDRCENVYVSGWGGGLNIQQGYSREGTDGLPEIDPLTGIPPADGQDFYFFVLRKDAQGQLFGSHFGQSGGTGDHVDGGTSRFDANGIIYQAICANCGGRTEQPPINYPTTPGVWSRTNGSNSCNEAALKIEINFAGVGAEIQSNINGIANDTLGCIPLTINFKDLQRRGVTYYWNFNSTINPTGTDTTTTTPEVTFTFNVAGTYRVRLIAEDLNTCNLRDTSYVTINASADRVTPRFTKRKIEPCTSTTYEFTNQSSTFLNTAFTNQSFVWDYGDGSPLDTTGAETIFHTYPAPGTYFVKLFVIDGRFCNAPDSLIDTLRLNPLVDARPQSPNLGCAPYTAVFTNNSLAGLEWKWEFGDPASGANNTSTDFEPTHIYQNVGVYQYRLIAFDSTTCNKADTSDFFTINVVEKPDAAGDWAPNPPQVNVPVSFSNTSRFADSYLWKFGDGDSSTAFAPVHEYNATGSYNAQLIAFNRAGCTDTFPLVVNVIINPLLDVPNAFTPGKFGINSVVNVRGFGIDKMMWRIYNRWGQLIFESTNKKVGWDGFYKGKLQPIDVYGYTLDAVFSDGTKVRKTGDITLLR